MNDKEIVAIINEYLQKGFSVNEIANNILHKGVNVTRRYISQNNLIRSEEGKRLLNERRLQKLKVHCEAKWGPGIINPGQAPEVKEKILKTFIDRYGCNPSSCDFFREKVKRTCLERYGVDNIAKSQKYQEIYATGIPRKKLIETRNKKNNWSYSQEEENIFEVLCTKFSKDKVRRQYRSDSYPWLCDFYIEEIDTYIEYQGIWTHGPAPYEPLNIEHQKLVYKWKEKDSPYYNRAIEKWTIKDPEKRKIAKENNLNWKEFFSMEEFYSWFNSL